jgi:hypothetical protein
MKNTSVIIAAAGKATRWNGKVAACKQLVPLPDGRPLIQRTVDLLREMGIRRIHIATSHPQIIDTLQGAEWILPTDCRFLSQTLLSSSHCFSKKTIILLGDVFYSREALGSIIHSTRPVQFFGLSNPPSKGPLRRREIYALSFEEEASTSVIAALKQTSNEADLRECKLRLIRVLRRLFHGTSAKHLRNAYSSLPPKPLRTLGIQPGRFWQFIRVVTGHSRHTRLYGKLWGLHMELSGTTFFEYKQSGSGEKGPLPLFMQIDDLTRDIDYEKDFAELVQTVSPKDL